MKEGISQRWESITVFGEILAQFTMPESLKKKRGFLSMKAREGSERLFKEFDTHTFQIATFPKDSNYNWNNQVY